MQHLGEVLEHGLVRIMYTFVARKGAWSKASQWMVWFTTVSHSVQTARLVERPSDGERLGSLAELLEHGLLLKSSRVLWHHA